MSNKYHRIDQDEAHYVNLVGDQYIGFISKQMGQELIDELAAKSAQVKALSAEVRVKTIALEGLKASGILLIRPGGASSVDDDRRDAIRTALEALI